MLVSKSCIIAALVLQSQEILASPVNFWKRASTTASTTTLTESTWTTTVSSTASTITPYAFDGVTVSASPAGENTTPWVSLDSSGIPYAVTPTVKDGSTTSASPTATNTGLPDPVAAPPVLRCINERVPSYTDPFCIANDTKFVVDETYWITWNPLYWNPYWSEDDVQKVKVRVRSYPDDSSNDDVYTSDYLLNVDGVFPLTIKDSYITSDNDGVVQIWLTPMITSDTDAHVMDTVEGPIVTMVSSDSGISRVPSDNSDDDDDSSSTSSSSSSSSTSTSKSSSSKSSNNRVKTLVPAIVVPIVVVAVIAFFVIYFFWNKKKQSQKNSDGEAVASPRPNLFSKGYTGSKSQRMGKETTQNIQTDNPFHDSSSLTSSPISKNEA